MIRIAKAQRGINLAVLFYFLVIPLMFAMDLVLPNNPVTGMIVGLAFLGVIVFGAIAVYRLAAIIRNRGVAIIYVIGMLVPLLGLLLLLSISQKATTILQEHGVKVGFLGANPSTI